MSRSSVAEVAEPRHGAGPAGAGHGRPRRPARVGIVVVMIAALLAAGGMQRWARDWQRSAVPGQIANSRAGIGSMNSFALALVLGGLRGPLVMYLWITSEEHKNDRDLESFDTMVEWIRMLQPEFDTVHMFQIWNKAYNLSVMMASPATKYQTILSAIQYAQDVLAERPDDMNIFESLGQVYGNKMSGESTQERPFYNQEFRLESMTDKARERMYGADPDFRRLGPKSFIFLDDNGNILPALLTPTRPRPASLPADKPWNNGAQLQYLEKYEPFPYGILPLAMAYNYDMASDAAMVSENQMPLQLSPLVTDSKPGLDLKLWAEMESKLATELTGQAYNLDADAQPGVIDSIAPGQATHDPKAIEEAAYRYGLSSRLAGDAIVQYNRHLANPAYYMQAQTYASHLMDLAGLEAISKADELFSRSLLATDPAQRRTLLTDARDNYEKGMVAYQREVLRFYTEAELARRVMPPKGFTTEQVMSWPAGQVSAVYAAVIRLAPEMGYSPHNEDRQLYSIPIARAAARIMLISQALR